MSRRVDILGLEVDALTIAEAVQKIVDLAERPGAHYVTKPYVEFVERAYHDADLRQLLNGAALSLPDGVALQWAAAYAAGRPGFWRLFSSLAAIALRPASTTRVLPERFAGVDTTWQLLRTAREAGLRVFLIGSPASGDISRTAKIIADELPGIIIAGTAPGEINGRRGEALYRGLRGAELDLQPLAAAIRGSRADLILTGIGFPQQDALNAALAQLLDRGVLVGEGGSFDYESFGGQRRRAPRAMRRMGLEWLWRLTLEPSRWRRQLAVPRFIWHVYRTYR